MTIWGVIRKFRVDLCLAAIPVDVIFLCHCFQCSCNTWNTALQVLPWKHFKHHLWLFRHLRMLQNCQVTQDVTDSNPGGQMHSAQPWRTQSMFVVLLTWCSFSSFEDYGFSTVKTTAWSLDGNRRPSSGGHHDDLPHEGWIIHRMWCMLLCITFTCCLSSIVKSLMCSCWWSQKHL